MRFRFCGDLDCPDWVLAEINTLSKMSSVKMKILCQVVAKSLIGHDLDKEKAKKLILDAKLETGDMKACVAALSFILSSSARYGVEEDALNNELQQLGLPKEHATALCKIYSENVSAMVEKAASESLRTSVLQDVNCIVKDGGKKKIEMDLKINDKIKNQNVSRIITLSPEQLALLLSVENGARRNETAAMLKEINARGPTILAPLFTVPGSILYSQCKFLAGCLPLPEMRERLLLLKYDDNNNIVD